MLDQQIQSIQISNNDNTEQYNYSSLCEIINHACAIDGNYLLSNRFRQDALNLKYIPSGIYLDSLTGANGISSFIFGKNYQVINVTSPEADYKDDEEEEAEEEPQIALLNLNRHQLIYTKALKKAIEYYSDNNTTDQDQIRILQYHMKSYTQNSIHINKVKHNISFRDVKHIIDAFRRQADLLYHEAETKTHQQPDEAILLSNAADAIILGNLLRIIHLSNPPLYPRSHQCKLNELRSCIEKVQDEGELENEDNNMELGIEDLQRAYHYVQNRARFDSLYEFVKALPTDITTTQILPCI